MAINKKNLLFAKSILGHDHAKCIVRLATKQDKLELQWDLDIKELGRVVSKSIAESVEEHGRPKVPTKIFQQYVLSHYFSVVANAVESTEVEASVIDTEKRLAKPKIPKSLAEVRKIYDFWRKTGKMPKGLNDLANRIRDTYLKKVNKEWRKYSQDYRNGEDVKKAEVVEKIKQAADTSTARARTIVRTETTNYYNDVRTEIYDQTDGVWGYLFLAIRDQGTTRWCTERVIKGKRGRHGLVYKKGDPLTTKEKPSCHWNCRSEMVPLTIYNPRHLRLIEDESKHRRNNTCYPLPEGWS